MISTRPTLAALLLAGLLCGSVQPLAAQESRTEYEGAAALGLALRRLANPQRVLMVGAHPDDESTQILSALALGQGAEVAYLSLTRGEGGQNGIGPELQEGLGLLRSEELLAARRLDGARQFFTRAYDYGFSKSADEAFRHWPRDSLLADVVAVVREFRPDVVISVFSGTPADGHGQHQVAGILAREAFDAAGDPGRFPGQLRRGLRPHSPARLYQALWRRDEGATERLATGELDPLFGRSHFQIAMASRSRHRSQDMGQLLEPGPRSNALRLLASRGPDDNGHSGLFSARDSSLSARALASVPVRVAPLLREYEGLARSVRAAFNPLQPERIVPDLAAAARLLVQVEQRLAAAPRPSAAVGDAVADLAFLVAAEREEAEEALWRAAGLVLDAVAEDETVVPGQSFALELTLWNGGREAVAVERLAPQLPAGWQAEPLDSLPASVAPGGLLRRRFRVTVAGEAAPTEPYFLRRPRQGDLYQWHEEVGGLGIPFRPMPVAAEARVGVRQLSLTARRDAEFRGLDKMQGEFRRPVRVVPAVAVSLEPGLAILPVDGGGAGAGRTLRVAVRLRAEEPNGIAGTLRLHAPAGWRVEPAAVPVRFAAAGEERVVELTVRPPAGLEPGEYPLRARFRSESGRDYDRGYSLVDYPHTRPQPLYRTAESAVRALDVRVPAGRRVGYVAGPGDDVPAALAQLGVAVELLGPEALASGDLGRFDVILTGIRAYEVRPDLLVHNQRLLDFARAGGTLIVQYNKYEYTEPGVAPYPVQMARPHDRVTDETAPVRILEPGHPLFRGPNRITEADFQGWVQERGLYFLSGWDPRYTPLLEMADPGEAPTRGALLVAPLGKGTYVYTGLSLFRQLPAGVPGAYRLFANLLSLGKE